jgi:cell division protease FtsH
MQLPNTSEIPAHAARTRRRVRWVAGAATVTILAAGAIAFRMQQPAARTSPATLTYSALLSAMSQSRVDSIAIVPGEEILGWWISPAGTESGFRVVYTSANVDGLVQRAEAANVNITFRSGGGSGIDYVNVGVSIALLLALVFMVRRQMSGGQGGGTDLGKTTASTTTFSNVAGNDGAIADLKEIVEFLRSPAKFDRLGARTPKGVLMFGPPGTGKTLMARAVAGEAGVPFWSISGSEVTGFIVGLGVMRIKSLFKKARKRGGVIFIDEIDALGGRRGKNQSHNEDDRTLNQLLIELDGFSPTDGVVVIAATNRAEDLDAALLRPGRFDRSVSVSLPSAIEREAILRLHAEQRRMPLDSDVDLGRLARLMPQTSGADLANLLNEAAIVAAQSGTEHVEWTHVESARDRLLLGKARSGFRASDREWRTVAMHEAGHALAGVMCCPEDGLHKVTIQPRGQAMGVAFFSPDSDQHLHSRRYLEGQILKGLGGRAAEEVLFGTDAITSGARSDLQHVTRIAKEMVYNLGMGASTGLMIYDSSTGPVSGELHAAMDREVRSIIDGLYTRTLGLMQTHRNALQALGDALLEQETIDGVEAVRIMTSHGLPPAELAA